MYLSPMVKTGNAVNMLKNKALANAHFLFCLTKLNNSALAQILHVGIQEGLCCASGYYSSLKRPITS